MALTKCKECNKSVSTEATSCPHCGVADPGRTEPAAPKKSKKRLYILIACLGFVGITVENLAKHRNAGKAQPPGAEVAGASGQDQCRDKGAAVATVYLNNFRQAAEVGAMPSEVMNEGCRRIAAELSATDDCRAYCEDGFRAVAKDAVQQATK